MSWLISGIALFVAVHLSSAVPGLRPLVRETIGEKAHRGAFAALAVAGFVMIVIGWRSTTPIAVYAPPSWGSTLAFLLMFVAIVLFGASHARTNIKRIVRHPQLSAVALWSVAHLAANGDSRSLLLFGSLGLWALIEMPLIDHRDGEWQRPERASMKNETIGATISVIVFLVLVALHPYYAGVSPLPA